jgi:hypothetical protein
MAQMQLQQQPLVSQGIHTQNVYLHANIHSHFPLMGHFPKRNQQMWFDVVTTIGTNIIVPKKNLDCGCCKPYQFLVCE